MRNFSIKFGAALFIAAIPVAIVGNILFGERGLAWAAVLMINPSLIVIGAAVGFSGIVRVFKDLRAGELFADGVLQASFSVSRALVFSSLFFVFLSIEIKAVMSLRHIVQ